MFGLGEVPHRGTGATQKLQNIHKTKTFEKATKHSAVFNKVMCPLKEERTLRKRTQKWGENLKWTLSWKHCESPVLLSRCHMTAGPAVIMMEAWLGWHIKRCKWGFQDFLQGRIYVQRKNKLFQLFWSFGELIVRFGLRIGFNMSFNKKFCLTYFWLLMCFCFCVGHPTQPITKYHFHPSIHPILKRGVSRPKDRSAHPSISALESISDSQNFARQSFSVVGLGWGWLQAADRCACFALFTTTGYDPKTLNIEIGLPSHPIHSPQRVWKFLGVNSW